MTTEPSDFYAVLGVTRDATQAQVSAAYRTLLRRYHPDTRAPSDGPHDAAADQALQHLLAAYAVLHDPARRSDYDQRTSPRLSSPGERAHFDHLAPLRHFDDPPLRAGPVHWTPPSATCHN